MIEQLDRLREHGGRGGDLVDREAAFACMASSACSKA